MNRATLGRNSVTLLQGALKNLLAHDDDILQAQVDGYLLKVNGIVPHGSLAQKVGQDYQDDSFHQDSTLRAAPEEGRLKFTECLTAIAIFVGDHALIQKALYSGNSADRRSLGIDFDRGGNEA